MSETATAGIEIGEWVEGLKALPKEGFPAACTEYVRAHPITEASLKPYAFFDADHYTRNLIFKSDLFEVLAICWEAGQESAIHNHRDQQCWMVMGSGCLETIDYEVTDQCFETGTCKLSPARTMRLTRAAPIAVDDDLPVHKVVNCPDQNKRAMSVHIYSRPFDTCEAYDYDAGTFKLVDLTYFSTFGEPVGN